MSNKTFHINFFFIMDLRNLNRFLLIKFWSPKFDINWRSNSFLMRNKPGADYSK